MSAVAQSLLLEFGALFALQDYEPIGTRLETLKGALLGEHGVSEHDLGELRHAVKQWTTLSDEVRTFYTRPAVLRNETARVVLYYTLLGRGQAPAVWQLQRLSALWADFHGLPPINHRLWLPPSL